MQQAGCNLHRGCCARCPGQVGDKDCEDVLMKTWRQSMMMVVAPEQEEKNARAPPYTHLLKFFFKGVDGLLNQDEDPPTPLKKNLS